MRTRTQGSDMADTIEDTVVDMETGMAVDTIAVMVETVTVMVMAVDTVAVMATAATMEIVVMADTETVVTVADMVIVVMATAAMEDMAPIQMLDCQLMPGSCRRIF